MVVDPDPLRRLHAVAAMRALGFAADQPQHERLSADPRLASRVPACSARPGGPSPASPVSRAIPAAFVALDAPDACRRSGAPSISSPSQVPPAFPEDTFVVGYGVSAEVLAAHRRHRCVDVALLLTAGPDAAGFAHLPPLTAVDAADITPREADVLVLLLAGLPGPAIARRLRISPATARAHVRAVLRKLGAADRRALRARLLGAGPW